MNDGTKRFESLYKEFPALGKCLLKTSSYRNNLLREINAIIINAGIDKFIFSMMENDILNGNFGVIYLDDRIVGEDKKRIKAKKELERIRAGCFKLKQQNVSTFEILFS